MQELEGLRDAMTFADTDVLRAFQAIAQHRPELVVLESLFASTSRGVALIHRIKADPSLSGCEIRIVTQENAHERPRPAPPQPPQEPAAEPPAPLLTPPAPPVTPAPVHIVIDENGTRRAPRFDMMPGAELLIDGTPATLLDLSLSGAQIASPATLRPNQRIRMTLSDPMRPVRLSGAIAWAIFEMSSGAPRYRAGVAFFEPDTVGIQSFIEEHKKAADGTSVAE